MARRLRLALLTTLATAALVAPVAHADLLNLARTCGATTQPFAQFGDSSAYTFVQDGGLEGGGSGWQLSGAHVVSGNESFFVHGSGDARSLSLPSGASATTPAACITLSSGKARFFARNSGSGALRVQVLCRGLLGGVIGLLDVTSFTPSANWQPSPEVINLNNLTVPLGTTSIQLRFTALSGSGVQIDDAYVDPLSSRD